MPKKDGVQYIASLKFRIDEAKKQLNELSTLTSDTSKSIGKELSDKVFKVKLDDREFIQAQTRVAINAQNNAAQIERINAEAARKKIELESMANAYTQQMQAKTLASTQANTDKIVLAQKQGAIKRRELRLKQANDIEKIETKEQVASRYKAQLHEQKLTEIKTKGETARMLNTEKTANKIREIEAREQAKLELMAARGAQNSGVMNRLLSNAKTYITYQSFNALRAASSDLVDELKAVETRMVEITRIMSDSTLVMNDYRDEIIALGQQYGRTFDETSDSVLRFARAGFDARESIMLTEKALLALNTAELNAEQATEDMIAVMAQWGYNTGNAKEEAEQLGNIIDMVNKVADNFPTTSEDLLNALKRTSQGFNLAGASIEETIALITAAEVATQRGGKVVGTALANMIQQIKTEARISSLEELGIDVFTDVNKTQYKSIIDIFQQMSDKMAQLKKEGKENSIEMQKLLTAFTVFRRNIGAGMLSGMEGEDSAYIKALETAMNAAGYSAQENSKYMQTFEAQINQLEDSALKLKTTIWDNGLEDALKSLVQTLSGGLEGLNKFVETFGSIPAAVTLATTAITAFTQKARLVNITDFSKNGIIFGNMSITQIREQIDAFNQAQDKALMLNSATQILDKSMVKYFDHIGTEGVATMGGYAMSVVGATVKTIALQAASVALNAAISFGISVAITGLIKLFDKLVTTQEEYNEAIKESVNNIKDIDGELEKQETRLKEIELELKEISNLRENGGVTAAQERQYSQLKAEEEVIQNQVKLLKEKRELENKNLVNTMEGRYTGRKNFWDNFWSNIGTNFDKEDSAARRARESAANYVKGSTTILGAGKSVGQVYSNISQTASADMEALQVLNKAYDEGKISTEKYIKYTEALEAELVELGNGLTDNINALEGTGEEGEALRDKMIGWQRAITDFLFGTKDAAESQKELQNELDESTSMVKTYSEVLQESVSKLKNLQTQYEAIDKAQKELNDTGTISISTFEALINSGMDTADMFTVVDGKIQLSTKALELKAQATKEDMIETVKNNAAAKIAAIVQSDAASAVDKARHAFVDANGVISENTKELIRNLAANKFLEKIAPGVSAALKGITIVTQDESDAIQQVTNEMNALIGTINQLGFSAANTYSSGGGGSSARDTANDILSAFKQMVDDLMEEDERWVEAQKTYNNYSVNNEMASLRERALAYRRYADEVMELEGVTNEEKLRQRKEFLKAAEDLEKQFYELAKNELDEYLSALDDAWSKKMDEEINKLEERKQAELDAIDKVEDARDRQLQAQEYRKKREELLYGYQGVEYWSQRTGRDAQLALAKAQDSLDELDANWKNTQHDWDTEDQKAAIEDWYATRIAAIEKAKDHDYSAAEEVGLKYIVEMGNVYEYERQSMIDLETQRVQSFMEANGNVMAAANGNASDLFKVYDENFLTPLEKRMSQIFDIYQVGETVINTGADIGTQIKQAIASGASKETVEALNDARVKKAISDSTLRQYAYDDIYQQAMEYISGGNSALDMSWLGTYSSALSSVAGTQTTSNINNSQNSNISIGSGGSLVNVNADVNDKVDLRLMGKAIIRELANKFAIN